MKMIFDKIKEILFPSTPGLVRVLSAESFKEHLAVGTPVLLDVRTKREFDQGHIAGARNLDIFQPGKFQSQCELLRRDQPVYLYCRSGNRSRKASKLLTRMGFKEIYDLKGGILNWY